MEFISVGILQETTMCQLDRLKHKYINTPAEKNAGKQKMR